MVLSGYLFAKLLGNKKINYPVFLYNRGLRLLPLLVCVLLIIAAQAYVDDKLNAPFFIHLLKGFVLPTLPNGGWSSSDVGEGYGEGFSLSILGKWIGKIIR